jgi:hypothetical protein
MPTPLRCLLNALLLLIAAVGVSAPDTGGPFQADLHAGHRTEPVVLVAPGHGEAFALHAEYGRVTLRVVSGAGGAGGPRGSTPRVAPLHWPEVGTAAEHASGTDAGDRHRLHAARASANGLHTGTPPPRDG